MLKFSCYLDNGKPEMTRLHAVSTFPYRAIMYRTDQINVSLDANVQIFATAEINDKLITFFYDNTLW